MFHRNNQKSFNTRLFEGFTKRCFTRRTLTLSKASTTAKALGQPLTMMKWKKCPLPTWSAELVAENQLSSGRHSLLGNNIFHILFLNWPLRSSFSKPKPAPVDKKTELLASSLPDSFDWRNISGVSYVSPIRLEEHPPFNKSLQTVVKYEVHCTWRNQGSCGSCYAFASMGLNEARLRIKTLNQKQNVFSTQDIVECSQYSQGSS